MKKLRTLTFVFTSVIIFGAILYSCENEERFPDTEIGVEEQITGKGLTDAKMLQTNCNVTGSGSADKNTSAIYSYITDIANPIITWSVVSGDISLTSGQGTPNATFQFGNSFAGGAIQALGANGDICSDTKFITCGDPPPPSCSCPTPVIDDVLCVSGGHPHWRFQLNNIASGDEITWSAQHASILTGQGTDYVIVQPTQHAGGFTVYCEVTRTCPDGSTKTRTAYYSNYYGGNCGNGATGYTDFCGGGDILPE